MTDTPNPGKPKLDPLLKFALDVGPLVVFFAVNARFDIFYATATFMVAVVAAVLVSYAITRTWPVMPLVTAVVVVVFGALTLWLHDPSFIKVKPTIVYTLLGAALLGGYVLDKPVLATVFDTVFHLTAAGWRKLTLRWALFFLVMAVVNEAVWRTQSTDFWVKFKLFGFVPLTFVFAALQFPLISRHSVPEASEDGSARGE